MDQRLRFLIPALVLLLPLACSSLAATAESLVQKVTESQAQGISAIPVADGTRFLPADLNFLALLASGQANLSDTGAKLAASDFARQLREHGIDLLFVPVPPKSLYQAESLNLSPETRQAALQTWRSLLEELREAGVPSLDLTEIHEAMEPNAQFFCQRDTHWSGRGLAAAAHAMGRALQSVPLDRSEELTKTPTEWRKIKIQGDLGGEPEVLELPFLPLEPELWDNSRGSPLVLMGDSHVLVFHEGGDLHATDSGLPGQIAISTGVVPDVVGVRGSGANSARVALARRARSSDDYLTGKRAVVWCLAGRDLVQGDTWKNIPILPE